MCRERTIVTKPVTTEFAENGTVAKAEKVAADGQERNRVLRSDRNKNSGKCWGGCSRERKSD